METERTNDISFRMAALIAAIFGILLLAAGFGYSMDGLGKVLIPGYSLSLIMFTFIGEVLLMLWLFIKGAKTQPITKNENDK